MMLTIPQHQDDMFCGRTLAGSKEESGGDYLMEAILTWATVTDH